ncbi:MAG: chloride channel protein [Methylovirgula sp.]
MTFRDRLPDLQNHSREALQRWGRRTLFLIGGLLVGAAAILMAALADFAQRDFHRLLGISRYLSLALTPLGFGAIVFMTLRVFPNSQGSGIPQVIAARELPDGPTRTALVSLRVALGKIVSVTLGLLCGASIGREGPTVQVGAALMYAMGRGAKEYQRGLLLAGAAAGIAAAFNTPLAGIVFGIEELSRSFESRTSGLVLGAIIAAGLTSLGLVGDYAYFGSTSAVLPLGRAWLVLPICAVLGGAFGGLFSRIVVMFARGLPGTLGRLIASHPIVFAMLCGLGVALTGLASQDTSYGTGYDEARAIVHGAAPACAIFGPMKFLATLISSIGGIPGGLFAPSLAVGAGLAANLHILFQDVPLGALALIGMVSYLTGVVQTPITSFVIVSEMTENHAMIIPLMLAALIADAVSKSICKDSIYHALAGVFLKNADKARAQEPE